MNRHAVASRQLDLPLVRSRRSAELIQLLPECCAGRVLEKSGERLAGKKLRRHAEELRGHRVRLVNHALGIGEDACVRAQFEQLEILLPLPLERISRCGRLGGRGRSDIACFARGFTRASDRALPLWLHPLRRL